MGIVAVASLAVPSIYSVRLVNVDCVDRETIRALVREELDRFVVRSNGNPFQDFGLEPPFTVEVAAVALPAPSGPCFSG
jgi:hypothetical protein